MPIFCSNLPNDQDMIKALGSIAIPCPLFTDCAFWGKGDGDTTISVGIERKKTGDLAQCIYDGRLLRQAQIAKENGIDVFCLIVETGEIRPNPDDGLLETKVWGIDPSTFRKKPHWEPVRPTIAYSRFDQYLTELAYLAGVIVKRSFDVRETAAIIKALWDNFQTPPSRHQSLKQIYKPPTPVVQLVQPSLARRMASELPGIGWERSGAVAQHFGSVSAMISAGVDEWGDIVTIDARGRSRKLGRKIAERVVSSITK